MRLFYREISSDTWRLISELAIAAVTPSATVQTVGGNKAKQELKIKVGIEQELAKQIVKIIKDSKIKVQASIQGDAVRVSGTKRDDLQSVIALLRKDVSEAPLDFNNFRD